jgi:hypothetical protein
MDVDEETVKKEVAVLVKYHRKIEKWVVELDDIFAPITNAMSIYYAMLICNIGFQAVVLMVIIESLKDWFLLRFLQ